MAKVNGDKSRIDRAIDNATSMLGAQHWFAVREILQKNNLLVKQEIKDNLDLAELLDIVHGSSTIDEGIRVAKEFLRVQNREHWIHEVLRFGGLSKSEFERAYRTYTMTLRHAIKLHYAPKTIRGETEEEMQFEDIMKLMKDGPDVTKVLIEDEYVGDAFQFLQFYYTFCNVLDLEEREAGLVLEDLLSPQDVPGSQSANARFHVKLLSLILNHEMEQSLVLSLEREDNGWLEILGNYLVSKADFKEVFSGGDMNFESFSALDNAIKLKVLDHLCDAALQTSQLKLRMANASTNLNPGSKDLDKVCDVVFQTPEYKVWTASTPAKRRDTNVDSLSYFHSYCEVLGLKVSDASLIMKDLLYPASHGLAQFSSYAKLIVQLLSLIFSHEKEISLKFSLENEAWLKALEKWMIASKGPFRELMPSFVADCRSYNALEASRKLKILNHLCDDALQTAKLKDWIDDPLNKSERLRAVPSAFKKYGLDSTKNINNEELATTRSIWKLKGHSKTVVLVQDVVNKEGVVSDKWKIVTFSEWVYE